MVWSYVACVIGKTLRVLRPRPPSSLFRSPRNYSSPTNDGPNVHLNPSGRQAARAEPFFLLHHTLRRRMPRRRRRRRRRYLLPPEHNYNVHSAAAAAAGARLTCKRSKLIARLVDFYTSARGILELSHPLGLPGGPRASMGGAA